MKPFNMEDPVVVSIMSQGDYILHGDVILFRESLPKDFEDMQKLNEGVIALGESTMHMHKLFGEFDLREDTKTKEKFLRVVNPTALRHQEHREITLPPGEYRIGIQREYDPFEKLTRQVID